MFLTNGSTYPIGLDISDLSLKLVQLNKNRDKIKIQALAKLNLPAGIIVNGEIKNPAELIKAIRKISTAPAYGKVTSEEAVVCLPESKTFIKLIEVAKSPNAIADVIDGEIEKHVPMALNEIYYDWQLMEETTDKYYILIGAAPKNIVDQYTQILISAKLSPAALEIEPEAIARCLLKEEAAQAQSSRAEIKTSQNYGIIDIGANHTCMIFYAGGAILFTVSMPISGESLTAKISETLNLTLEQAEKVKIICGLDQTKANGVIREILADMIKNLTAKIKEAMTFYENYFSRYGAIKQILLCGGGANIIGLEKIISQELSSEIKLGDALTNIQENKDKFQEIFLEKHSLDLKSVKLGDAGQGKSLSIKQNSSGTFATAFGLALRGIFIDEL